MSGTKVRAETPQGSCGYPVVGSTTPASPSAVGTGYVYRTFRIMATENDNLDLKGGVFDITCQIANTWTLGDGTVEAVQAYLGRHLDSHSGGSLAAPGLCVPQQPDYNDNDGNGASDPPLYRCMSWTGDFPIYQDDAAIISVNGAVLSCLGIYPCGNIYGRGISPGGTVADGYTGPTGRMDAYKGAGFVDVPARSLNGNGTSVIGTTNVRFIVGNTWGGNYEGSVLITMKYKQNPPGTDVCPNIAGDQATVPSGMVKDSSGNCVYPPPPQGCPSLPNPNVIFSLPDRSPVDNGPPPSATTAPNQTYWQTQRKNQTEVTGTDDISENLPGQAGSGRVGSPPYRLPLVSESYQSATISYQPFIDECPYDQNQGRVYYNSYYQQRRWRSASSPSYYTCGSGGYLISTSTCRYDYYEYHYHYQDASYCGTWEHYHSSTRRYHTHANSCYHPHPAYYTYPATAWYNYSVDSSWQDRTATGSADGTVMQPCYDRLFQSTVTGNTLNGANFDSDEEVTRVDFSTPVTATFARHPNANPSARLRKQNRVIGHQVGATYTLFRADGSQMTYSAPRAAGCDNRMPGTIDIRKNGTGTMSFNSIQDTYTDCFEAYAAPAGTLRAGDYICMTVTFPYTGSQVNQWGNITATSGGATFNHGGAPGTPGCTGRIGDRPYFGVFGGDILAGSGFKTPEGACTATAGSQILAWNRGSAAANPRYGNTQWGGAGVRLASMALGSIQQFISAKGRTTDPVHPRGLSFANQLATYGGNWDAGNVGCSANYFAEQQGGPLGTANLTDVNGLANASYTSGDLVIGNGTPITVNAGKRIVLFVDGNVHIRSDISYASSYTSLSQIPSVRIIARNIYIAPNVTNIESVLVAQPTSAGAGGNVLTCSGTANFSNPNGADLTVGGCRSNLTIRGALVAKKVYFLRTIGSIRSSTLGENEASPNMAERIIFSPTVWLADPASDPINKEPYEAYTSMPPIL